MTNFVSATRANQKGGPQAGPAARPASVDYVNVDLITRMWQHPNPRDKNNPFTVVEFMGGRNTVSYIEPLSHFVPGLGMSPPTGV